MKRIALIAVVTTLLAGCQNSKSFCAEFKAGDKRNASALKKLGIETEKNWFFNPTRFEQYCQHEKGS